MTVRTSTAWNQTMPQEPAQVRCLVPADIEEGDDRGEEHQQVRGAQIGGAAPHPLDEQGPGRAMTTRSSGSAMKTPRRGPVPASTRPTFRFPTPRSRPLRPPPRS